MTIIQIDMIEREGALQRIIGLIERRGFSIQTLDKSAPMQGLTTLKLEVAARESLRTVDVLVRQIARLFDVYAVSTLQPMPHVMAHQTALPPGSLSCRTLA